MFEKKWSWYENGEVKVPGGYCFPLIFMSRCKINMLQWSRPIVELCDSSGLVQPPPYIRTYLSTNRRRYPKNVKEKMFPTGTKKLWNSSTTETTLRRDLRYVCIRNESRILLAPEILHFWMQWLIKELAISLKHISNDINSLCLQVQWSTWSHHCIDTIQTPNLKRLFVH